MNAMSKTGGAKPWVGRRILLAAAGALFLPAIAHANLIISISDTTDGQSASATNSTPTALPGTTFSLADGFLGPVGSPDIGYTDFKAFSNSTGSSGGAEVTIKSIELTNLSSSTQTVALTVADNGYTLPGSSGSTLDLYGSYSLTAQLGTYNPTTMTNSASTGTASMTSFGDPTNSANASTTVGATSTSTLLPTGFNSDSPFASSIHDITGVAAFTRSSAFSLAGVTTITLDPGAIVDLSDNTVTFATTVAPEPTSLGMLGLAGAGLLGRRRRANVM